MYLTFYKASTLGSKFDHRLHHYNSARCSNLVLAAAQSDRCRIHGRKSQCVAPAGSLMAINEEMHSYGSC